MVPCSSILGRMTGWNENTNTYSCRLKRVKATRFANKMMTGGARQFPRMHLVPWGHLLVFLACHVHLLQERWYGLFAQKRAADSSFLTMICFLPKIFTKLGNYGGENKDYRKSGDNIWATCFRELTYMPYIKIRSWRMSCRTTIG